MISKEELMKRLPTDFGGLPAGRIERIEHELEPWEKRCHALARKMDEVAARNPRGPLRAAIAALNALGLHPRQHQHRLGGEERVPQIDRDAARRTFRASRLASRGARRWRHC
jgi:hypothetical protein